MINSLHYDYYHSYSHYGNYYRLIKWPLMVNINDKKIIVITKITITIIITMIITTIIIILITIIITIINDNGIMTTINGDLSGKNEDLTIYSRYNSFFAKL